MRFLALLFIGLGHLAAAQTQLTGVNVNIESSQNEFKVRATYSVEVQDDTEGLNLKALTFGGARISDIRIVGFEPVTSQDYELTSIRIPFTKIQKPQKVIVQYQVVPGEKGEIPIFFGDWQSASSDQDFFQLELNTAPGTNLLFPADSETSEDATIIRATLPATTSMIRVEQGSDSGSTWISRIDQLVIAIFMVIGVLIWFNRKRLIYG